MFIFKVSIDEIDKMISTVDRNGDGRISYSEFRFQSHPEKNAKIILKKLEHFFFRVMLGAFPLIIPNDPKLKKRFAEKGRALLQKN